MALRLLRLIYQKITLVPSSRLAIAAVLAVLGFVRLLPASYLQAVDRLMGRPGDAVLLLVVMFLLAFFWLIPRPTASPSRSEKSVNPVVEPVKAMLDSHLQLDHEIDKKLIEVVGDTESSALAIITQVRQLYDTASTLVTYLDTSSLKASDLGQEISSSVAYLVEIGTFLQELPVKMERDLQNVHSIVKEINDLSGLVGAVQAISMQSHLLAINAAIEGSRAGPSGAAFRIVASEMRQLASNSSGVAAKINEGLARARHVVVDGMAASIEESSQQLKEVSQAGESIRKLHENFEDMSQYYKIRFAVVTKYNEDLAKDISEVLGQIQYQDVVSQCIDRLRVAIDKRNVFFQNAVGAWGQGNADLTHLPPQLAQILSDYITEEERHKHSARHATDDSSEPKIELF